VVQRPKLKWELYENLGHPHVLQWSAALRQAQECSVAVSSTEGRGRAPGTWHRACGGPWPAVVTVLAIWKRTPLVQVGLFGYIPGLDMVYTKGVYIPIPIFSLLV
jgi:hypothetical protein